MNKLVILGCLALTIALGLSGAAMAQDRICFYEHINYQGRVVCWDAESQYSDLTQLNRNGLNWNDKISSVRFSGNAGCTVYQHIHFQGISLNLVQSTPDLRYVQLSDGRTYNWNDVISSLKVYWR